MTGPLEYCAELVAYACDGKSVPVAWTYKSMDRVWLTPREIRQAANRRAYDTVGTRTDENMPSSFGSAMLQRAAKAGLIAGRNIGEAWSARTEWRFTTLELAEAWDAELGLSDAERAERTAVAVRELYQENVVRRGDSVDLWPVACNLAAVPQDGISPAVDAGILVSFTDRSGEKRLVPVERYDAFDEAFIQMRSRKARAAVRHNDLVSRLHPHAGGDRRDLDRLSTDQLERLLALIEP